MGIELRHSISGDGAAKADGKAAPMTTHRNEIESAPLRAKSDKHKKKQPTKKRKKRTMNFTRNARANSVQYAYTQ